jgi:hypothetical protein
LNTKTNRRIRKEDEKLQLTQNFIKEYTHNLKRIKEKGKDRDLVNEEIKGRETMMLTNS